MCSHVYLPLPDSELLEVRDCLMYLYIPKAPHTTPGINSILRIYGWKERTERGRDRGKMV